MNDSLRLGVIILAFILFIIVTYILKKGRMPIKYAIVWYFANFVILVSATFPVLMTSLAHLMGFEILSNMIICILVVLLLFITMMLTIIASGQTTKIRLLIQEISILKSKIK